MKQCLIVEDSPVIRKVARLIVEQIGYKAVEAEDASIALDLCAKQIPELILLDWHLPGVSAHDFLGTLSAKFPDTQPQILYCTTEMDPKDIRRAFAGGISDFILKPYDRDSLQEKISGLARAA